MAQDRLFQLEAFRRATSGRLAEMLGSDSLEDDIVARRDYYTDAEIDAQLAKLPATLLRRAEAYRDGINAHIAEVRANPLEMPGEFPALGIAAGRLDAARHRPRGRLPRAHGALRRRRGAEQRPRAAAARPRGLPGAAAAAHPRTRLHRPAPERPLPLSAGADTQAGEERVRALARVRGGPEAARQRRRRAGGGNRRLLHVGHPRGQAAREEAPARARSGLPLQRPPARLLDPGAVRGVRAPLARAGRARRERGRRAGGRDRPQRATWPGASRPASPTRTTSTRRS